MFVTFCGGIGVAARLNRAVVWSMAIPSKLGFKNFNVRFRQEFYGYTSGGKAEQPLVADAGLILSPQHGGKMAPACRQPGDDMVAVQLDDAMGLNSWRGVVSSSSLQSTV